MPAPFIIKVLYGGLGDHLFFSHLPRIVKEGGFSDRVYISNLSEYRSPAYRDLIWGLNPYVDGFVDEDAPFPVFDTLMPGTNLLDRIMLERGLDDGRRFHEPEFYHRPKRLPELVNTCVYDPNYMSFVGSADPGAVTRLLQRDLRRMTQLQVRDKSVPLEGSPPTITTESFEHYCDIIFSCRRFYCLSSGGATLAAALRRPSTVYYGAGQNPMFHHSRLHRYCEASPPPPMTSTQAGRR